MAAKGDYYSSYGYGGDSSYGNDAYSEGCLVLKKLVFGWSVEQWKSSYPGHFGLKLGLYKPICFGIIESHYKGPYTYIISTSIH